MKLQQRKGTEQAMAPSSTAVMACGGRSLGAFGSDITSPHPSSSLPSMPSTTSPDKIRISQIGGRYLVFDVEKVARLRRHHAMCSVLVGITPQAPNQTVFSGLPLELSADEVRWLVHDTHVAYIADDRQAHMVALSACASAASAPRRAYMDSLLLQRRAAQKAADAVAAERERHGAEIRAGKVAAGKAKAKAMANAKAKAEAKKVEKQEKAAEATTDKSTAVESTTADPNGPVQTTPPPQPISTVLATDRANDDADVEPLLEPPPRTEDVMQQEDTLIFGGRVEEERMKAERAKESVATTSVENTESKANDTMSMGNAQKTKSEIQGAPRQQPLVRITPTTSDGLVGGRDESDFDREADGSVATHPPAGPSAALRAHLADRGFYTTPGLRFGGLLSVYPGDPFRYHAHYVAASFAWDEPIVILDLVSTGRLATGVKKGLLIGGPRPADEGADSTGKDDSTRVRTFTLEWAAM